MAKVVTCVQARMGSTRFPGKMMVELDGRFIILWVLRRLLKCKKCGEIILSTSVNSADDPMVELVEKEGIVVKRGSEDDVLARFCQIIRETGCDSIVRVCGDNPLIDPVEVDRIIEHHIKNGADYTFNHIPAMGNNYPDGLGAEVFISKVLLDIMDASRDPEDHEHINNYVLRNISEFNVETIPALANIAHPNVRLDVDTEEDLEYLQNIVKEGCLGIDSSAEDIINAARKHVR